jgi:hypothetical protein
VVAASTAHDARQPTEGQILNHQMPYSSNDDKFEGFNRNLHRDTTAPFSGDESWSLGLDDEQAPGLT